MAPTDRRRIRMHHAETVVGRVPELPDTSQLRATCRDLADERGRPTLRDQAIARSISGVIRQTRGLVMPKDVVGAVVVRVALRSLHETWIRRHGRRADRKA